MKPYTILFLLTLGTNLHAQTKVAAFTKAETAMKSSVGTKFSGFTITEIRFSETQVKLAITGPSETENAVVSGINWEDFDFTINYLDDYPAIAQVEFQLEHDAVISESKSGQNAEKRKDDTFSLFIKKEDAKKVELALEELKAHTWELFSQFKSTGKESLLSETKKILNSALAEGEDASVKSITECELILTKEGEGDMILPIKGMSVHGSKDFEEEFPICYGEEKAVVKTVKNGVTNTRTVEHPGIVLVMDIEAAAQLNYAINRWIS